MFGWNYPPGVMDADIDRHFGEYDIVTGTCGCGGDLFNGAEDCDSCLTELAEAEDAADRKFDI